MKNNIARITLFSIIAMMSLFLMGSANQSKVDIPPNCTKQLEEITASFNDIPIANRRAWKGAIASNPELLLRLSTRKLVSIK